MIKVNFGDAFSAEFKSKFSELTVGDFTKYMVEDQKIRNKMVEGAKLEDDLENVRKGPVGNPLEPLLIESELLGIDNAIRILKIRRLAQLTSAPEQLVDKILTTPGVTHALISLIARKVDTSLGDFIKFFDDISPVEVFRFKDYKKPHWYSFTKLRKFKVYSPADTSVLRDSAAQAVATKIDEAVDGFKANNWTFLADFISYIARPIDEHKEIDVTGKKGFLKKSDIEGLNVEDRLTAYNEKLEEHSKKRRQLFLDLPLITALGIYKQYFFLRSR